MNRGDGWNPWFCVPLASMAAFAAFPVSDVFAQTCSGYWARPGYLPPSFQQLDGGNRFAVHDDGTGPALFVGGTHYEFPTEARPAVYSWRGDDWEPVGSVPVLGTAISVLRLDAGNGQRLHAYGYQDMPSGPSVWWSVVLSRGTWQPTARGFMGPNATPFFSFDGGAGPAVYGLSMLSPGNFAVARWDKNRWAILGSPPCTGPSVFASYDSGTGPELYVAGNGTAVFGPPLIAGNIAKWNGTTWQPVGAPWATSGPGFFTMSVRAMCVYDDGSGPALYVGGNPGMVGGEWRWCIAKWNGQAWSDVGGGVYNGGSGFLQINALEVFDDGSGPGLYAAGYFTSAGGVPAKGIARWNGSSWSALGAGFLEGAPYDLAVYDDGQHRSLFATGLFHQVGGGTSKWVAEWIGCGGRCYADCNKDGLLNLADFGCFQTKYALQDPYVNCNVDAGINLADFTCFQTKFALGCP